MKGTVPDYSQSSPLFFKKRTENICYTKMLRVAENDAVFCVQLTKSKS